VSYNRRQQNSKQSNFVAKHDFNHGGFHGKPNKSIRRNEKADLSKIDLYDTEYWEEVQNELGHER